MNKRLISLSVMTMATVFALVTPAKPVAVAAKEFNTVTTFDWTVFSGEREIALNEFDQFQMTIVETATIKLTVTIESNKELVLESFGYTVTVDRQSGTIDKKGSTFIYQASKDRVLVETIVKNNGTTQDIYDNLFTYETSIEVTLESSRPGEYVVGYDFSVENKDLDLLTESSSIVTKFVQVPTKKR
jgi:hypothetical protein